jgi:hypothetical protein
MMMHSLVRRTLRKEFVSNARSLDSIYFQRFLSSTQENDGVVSVRKGTVNPLLIPIIGSEKASWREAVKKVYINIIISISSFYFFKINLLQVLGLRQGTFSSR